MRIISVLTALSVIFMSLPALPVLAELPYRNLAFQRAAYHSSSDGVNEVAQLVTDGVVEDISNEVKMAYTFEHKDKNSARYGNVKYLFDKDTATDFVAYSRETWVQVRLPRKTIIEGYSLSSGSVSWNTKPFASSWKLQGSMDGTTFTDIDQQSGQSFTAQKQTKNYSITNNTTPYMYYRLSITGVMDSDRIHMSEWDLFDSDGETILSAYNENVFAFVSCWMSGGTDEEWVYVDLGEESTFDQTTIYWGSMYATKYDIQVSDDAKTWTTIASNTNGTGDVENVTFQQQRARYVRLLLKETAPDNIAYIVREFEVWGTNSIDYKGEVDLMPEPKADGTQYLSGGNWKLAPARHVDPTVDATAIPEVDNDQADNLGTIISSSTFDDGDWLPAIVPGTALTSYLRAGAVADPNYGDQQVLVSDSYFKNNFWYRNHFIIPSEKSGEKVWLNFDAINWKAEVYFNGNRMGNIRGGFTRAKFDVTEYVNFGNENYLAVLIYKNTDPGTAYFSNNDGPGTMGGVFGNDGSVGRDAPTYGAAGGWDWVPTVRGRDIGIYNDVFISYTKDVQIIDPWMTTTFNKNSDGTDLSSANLVLKTEVANTSDSLVTATVIGSVETRSDLTFSKQVQLAAGETKEVVFDSVVMTEPDIWWPNGYGEQPLYKATVSAEIEGIQTDIKTFNFGVREFSYSIIETDAKDPNGYNNGDNLAIICNGVRIIVRGGNWGLPEINLALDAEAYDEKIRLHKLENFNIIRNWGGQTNDPELYDACDKYGILLYDDFFLPGCWLHDPEDDAMFLANVDDKIKKYRYHASVALYCGANEMYLEDAKALDAGMRERVVSLDGTRHFVPHSAAAPLSPGGPHSAQLPSFYFNNTPAEKIIVERGMPNVPVAETMRMTMPEEYLMPHNDMWALHDFPLRWNVNGAGWLNDLKNYGNFETFDEMIKRAQMQGYELHKAMFEGSMASGSYGLLMWMSNPAWPSLVWQSYDYFHDINGGYSGIAAACQPINLIWNSYDNDMMLFNGGRHGQTLKAITELYDLNGNLINTQHVTKEMSSGEVSRAFKLQLPGGTSELQFIKTRVENQEGEILGENFYWNNINAYQDYTALADMPQIQVDARYQLVDGNIQTEFGTERKYSVTVTNNSDTPALFNRIKVMQGDTDERVLPVFYEENYFSLMPGDTKTVTLELKEKNLNEKEPRFEIEGWNVKNSVMAEGIDDYYISNVRYLSNGEKKGMITAGEYVAEFDITANKVMHNFESAVSIVLYKSNRIVDVETKSFNKDIDEGETVTLTSESITVPDDETSDYSVRSYIWTGFGNMDSLKNTTSIGWLPLIEQSGFGRNIAIGASIRTSHSYGDDGKAIDGSLSTTWGTGWSHNHWLEIDLGEEKTFSSITIDWGENYGKTYRIRVSNDGVGYTDLVQKEDGRGGKERFNFPLTSARYIRWEGTEASGDYGFQISEFSVIDNNSVNKADGATATASSSEDVLSSASRVIDGDLSSRWIAGGNQEDNPFPNQWILIDLGEPKVLSEIDIYWEAAYASGYKIGVSNDNLVFTDIKIVTGGDGLLDRHKFDAVEARYVKLDMTQRATMWKYSIYEIGIY